MSEDDTSDEAVERLAAVFDATVFAVESPVLRREYQRTAAMLRALRAEQPPSPARPANSTPRTTREPCATHARPAKP